MFKRTKNVRTVERKIQNSMNYIDILKMEY